MHLTQVCLVTGLHHWTWRKQRSLAGSTRRPSHFLQRWGRQLVCGAVRQHGVACLHSSCCWHASFSATLPGSSRGTVGAACRRRRRQLGAVVAAAPSRHFHWTSSGLEEKMAAMWHQCNCSRASGPPAVLLLLRLAHLPATLRHAFRLFAAASLRIAPHRPYQPARRCVAPATQWPPLCPPPPWAWPAPPWRPPPAPPSTAAPPGWQPPAPTQALCCRPAPASRPSWSRRAPPRAPPPARRSQWTWRSRWAW